MGHWQDIELPWYETKILNCSLCGKMIPRKVWIAKIDGEEREFCNPDCEKLNHEYWVPTHSKKNKTGRKEH